MSALLANFFQNYDDFCWRSNQAYLVIIQYTDGVKSLAYLTAMDSEDGGLNISVQHFNIDPTQFRNWSDFEILKIANLDDLNSHITSKSFLLDFKDSNLWQDVKNVLDDGDSISDFGWSLVRIESPETELHERDHGSTVGYFDDKIRTDFYLAHVGYDLMDDNKILGLELDIYNDDFDLKKITLKNPNHAIFENALSKKIIKLDVETILNS